MSSDPLPSDPIAEAHRQWVGHGWPDAADGMAAVTSIFRVQQILLSRIDAVLRPLDLSFSRFELLVLLSFTREGVLPMSNATARLQVHPTSVTNIVDRLERDCLVERAPNPRDARSTLVVLTEPGRLKAATATRLLNTEVFEHPVLEPDDLAMLIRVLARFRRDSGDFKEPQPSP